jgi:hypothetical protein
MKRRIGIIAVNQIGLFLSAVMAFLIGGAWNNYVQSSFEVSSAMLAQKHFEGTSNDAAFHLEIVKNTNTKNLRYALIVTGIGLVIMVAWTFFVQEIDPDLAKSITSL